MCGSGKQNTFHAHKLVLICVLLQIWTLHAPLTSVGANTFLLRLPCRRSREQSGGRRPTHCALATCTCAVISNNQAAWVDLMKAGARRQSGQTPMNMESWPKMKRLRCRFCSPQIPFSDLHREAVTAAVATPPPYLHTLWNNGVIGNIFNRCAIITLINWKTKRLIYTSQNKCCLAQLSSLCLGFCSCGFATYCVKKNTLCFYPDNVIKKSLSFTFRVYIYI